MAFVAVLFAATFVSCNTDDDNGDKTSTVRMYVSAETGLRLPFGATGEGVAPVFIELLR